MTFAFISCNVSIKAFYIYNEIKVHYQCFIYQSRGTCVGSSYTCSDTLFE